MRRCVMLRSISSRKAAAITVAAVLVALTQTFVSASERISSVQGSDVGLLGATGAFVSFDSGQKWLRVAPASQRPTELSVNI